MLRLRILLGVVLAGCRPQPAPEGDSARPPTDDGTGPPAPEPSGAAFDRALAEIVAACTPSPLVNERRIDLDRDGRDEAIVSVRCGDVSRVKLLAEHDGAVVTALDRLAKDTSFEVLLSPAGKTLLVIQHDCCCTYALEVLTLEAGTMRELFAWRSGCAPGCDGAGYKAEVSSDAGGILRSITLPIGACGKDGRASIDLQRWTPAE